MPLCEQRAERAVTRLVYPSTKPSSTKPSPGCLASVAYAHSVLTTPCELNSPDIASARPSNAKRGRPLGLYLSFAIMLRVLAICRAPNSCMFCIADSSDSSSFCNACFTDSAGTPRATQQLQDFEESCGHINMIKLHRTCNYQCTELVHAFYAQNALVELNVVHA